jgi:hypothetical protein
MMVERGANLNAEDSFGRTPIHKAAWSLDLACLEKFISLGANVNCKDFSGTTPLHWVCKEGNVECAKLLTSHGADSTIVDMGGETAYDMAVVADHIEILDLVNFSIDSSGRDTSQTDLKQMFRKVGFSAQKSEQYEKLFKENDIDISVLPQLDHEVLQSIGIATIGDRLKILKLKSKSARLYLYDIQILDVISAGAFGEVFRGLRQDEKVALKKLQVPGVELDAEAAILTKVKHPNIGMIIPNRLIV